MRASHLTWIALAFSATAESSAAAQAPAASAEPTLPGTWTATPIVETAKPDPESGGTFRTLGDAWVLSDGSTVFWAKFGEKDKGGWALYSAKDGPPRLVMKADVQFTEPDGEKKAYYLFDFGRVMGTSDLFVGRHAIFMSLRHGRNAESVYAVTGGRLIRLLGTGDSIAVGGERAVFRRATVKGITHDGVAVLRYWTAKPVEAEGWLLHDGRQYTRLWNVGDAVPGETEAVKIVDMPSEPQRFGDTTLVIFDTKRGRGQSILYRLTPGRAERMLVSEAPSPVDPGGKLRWPEQIRPVSGDRFLLGVGADQFVINRSQGFFAWQNDYKPRWFPTQWLEYRSGNWRRIMSLVRTEALPGLGPLADSIAYLRSGGDSILVAASYIEVGPNPPYGGGPQVTRRVPGFYLWDGSALSRVALTSPGLDLVSLSESAKKGRRLLNPFGVYPLSGSPGTVVAEIPGLLGGAKLLRAGEAGPVPASRFTMTGTPWPAREVDIVGWVDERTVVVRKQVLDVVLGFYRFVRE